MFQAPSLDKKLTVRENLRHQGHLYGLSGAALRQREAEMLDRLGLADRAGERVETLSGGLRRRVELAKGMLHRPRLLLLDEPSTGLDPGARSDLWNYLRTLRDEHGVTVVLTTHLLEEADKADRIAILHEGRLVALDTPDALAGDGRRRLDHDSSRRSGPAGRGDRRSGSAASRSVLDGCRAAGTARRPPVDRAAGRGVSRPDRVDHAGQADAGRRVHRPHRPPLLAGRRRRAPRRRGEVSSWHNVALAPAHRVDDRPPTAPRPWLAAATLWPARVGALRRGSAIACSARSASRSFSGCCSAPGWGRRFAWPATRRRGCRIASTSFPARWS